MIDELDEALRQLLIRELPIRDNEIDVRFDQPKREWSARLSRPTVNLYLYDVREDVVMRRPTPAMNTLEQDGRAVLQQRRPARLNLHYIITAWTVRPEDDHRLLGRTLMAMLRNPYLPEEMVPDSLRNGNERITILTAQPEILEKPTDLWNVMDNEMRPALPCTIKMVMNPYVPFTTPLVRTRDLLVHSMQESDHGTGNDTPSPTRRMAIGGTITSAKPFEGARLTLVGSDTGVTVAAGDRYRIVGLEPGSYVLELTQPGQAATRHPIEVPSGSYDIHV